MNNLLFFKSNLSLIQKICLAGLFIALITILQKVVAINYISFIPFLRISFGGCALLIFASILLGPWFGLLIGALSDILGYFIFDPKTMGFFPQITAIYALMGLVAYFIFVLVRIIKSKKLMMIVEYGLFAGLLAAITLYLCLNDSIALYSSVYQIELWQKITIPLVLLAFFILLVVLNTLMEKYFKKHNLIFNVYQVSFASLIIEVVVMIMFGTLMKGFAFGFQTYPAILVCQIITAFFNIPLNTFLVSYMLKLTRSKFICQNVVNN